MNCLYSLKNVCLKYPQGTVSCDDSSKFVSALNNLTLDIYQNEYLVVLGANGCGKSSLGKLLAGIAQNVSGEIIYRGQKVELYNREIFSNAALVIQEPQYQLLMPTVEKELSFPLENRGCDHDVIQSKVKHAAEHFGLSKLLFASPEELSGGQITCLAMACAMITEPEVIILDEPDSHLDNKTKQIVDQFIRQYHGHRTIILITQYPQIARHADRVVILKDGKLTADGKPDEILSNNQILKENNLKFNAIKSDCKNTGKAYSENAKARVESNTILLSLENVSFAYKDNENVLKNINLDLFKCEKVAIVGPTGSGKTTLGLIMAGLLRSKNGAVLFDGKTLSECPRMSLCRLATMAMQFPERALFRETVAEDIAFGPENVNLKKIDGIVAKYLFDFEITPLKNRHPFSLSGGEKRKTALAGVLALESQIIILDEPSAALDPKSTEKLIELLNSLTDKTVVIISHDLNFIARTCQRIIGLRNGSIICDLPASDFFSDNKLQNRLAINPTSEQQ